MAAMCNSDPTLSGKELSARLGLSESRLVRVFKRQMGLSIVEYRNHLRFKRLFELLAVEGRQRPSLQQAAQQAGFGSYAHFHRLFRARWHMGPRQGVRAGVALSAEAARCLGAPTIDHIVAEGGIRSRADVDAWLDRAAARPKVGNA